MALIRRTPRPLFFLLMLSVILRIPSLMEPYWYGDEAIYLTIGEAIRKGVILYKEIFDHKPPAIYLIAAISGSLFWFKFILLVWHSATVVVFWKLLKHFFARSQKIVNLGTLGFLLITTLPTLEGNIANSELFMLGPTLLAFYIYFLSNKFSARRFFYIGILFSISLLFKVPAIFDFLTLCAFIVLTHFEFKGFGKITRRLLFLTLGLLTPIFLSLLVYWFQGALGEYVKTAWFDNFTYISLWSSSSSSFWGKLTTGNMTARVLVVGVSTIILLIIRNQLRLPVLFSCLWIVFSLFGALLSARPYPHYIIQTIPAVVLLIVSLVAYRGWNRLISFAFLALFGGSLIFYQFRFYSTTAYYRNFLSFSLGLISKDQYFQNFDSKTLRTYTISKLLALRTKKSDRIFIWGTAPEIYALSRRIPPTRYITSFHLTDFGGRDESIAQLTRNKPKYIVILPEENREFGQLFKFLRENYIHVETVEDAQIWKLFDPIAIRALYN